MSGKFEPPTLAQWAVATEAEAEQNRQTALRVCKEAMVKIADASRDVEQAAEISATFYLLFGRWVRRMSAEATHG